MNFTYAFGNTSGDFPLCLRIGDGKLYASSQCKFRGVTFQGHLDCCTISPPEQVLSGGIAKVGVGDWNFLG